MSEGYSLRPARRVFRRCDHVVFCKADCPLPPLRRRPPPLSGRGDARVRILDDEVVSERCLKGFFRLDAAAVVIHQFVELAFLLLLEHPVLPKEVVPQQVFARGR